MSELPGGWSVDEVAHIARVAAVTQFGRIVDVDELADAALVAMCARLYEDPLPSLADLRDAARTATHRLNRQEAQARGFNQDDSQSTGSRTRPAWAAYWRGQHLLVSPFEETLLDRLAARQIWAALPPTHRETLAALVEAGSYQAARQLLGCTEPAWHNRLRKARIRARQLWHSPDPDPGPWGRDRREATTSDHNRGLRRLAVRRRAQRKEAA